MKAIRLDLIGLYNSGDERHPQQVMRNLGIQYEQCEPFPIGDCWIFYKVTNIPNDLPEALKLIDLPDDTLDEKPKQVISRKEPTSNIKGKLIKMKIGDQEITLQNDLTLTIKD